MYSREKNMVKLIDMGVSIKIGGQDFVPHLKGTSRYLGPEQLRHRLVTATDIWQFACVLT